MRVSGLTCLDEVTHTKNYRTTAQITLEAYSLLEVDSNIIEDEEFVRPSLIDRQGVFPVCRQFGNPEQEAEYILQEVKENLLSKFSYRDIVIIAKGSNSLSPCGS